MGEVTDIEKRSFRIDSIRQAADGAVQPLIDSVFMIVAINYFAAGDFWKGLIAASMFIGYLLSAPLTGALNRTGIPRSTVLSLLTMLSSGAMLIGVFAPNGIIFALAVSLSSAAMHLRQPFFSDLYGEVYPAARRARRISPGLRMNLVLALVLGLLYGRLLDGSLDRWRWILAFCVLIQAFSSIMLTNLPREANPAREDRWWQALAMPFRNPVFLYVQASWMLIGFGNLWTLPLRAVYLAESERGMGLSPATVTLVLVVIPVSLKLLFIPIWARLYHRMSFPALRMSINVFFMTSIPLFFLTERLPIIILSSILFGIGTSGSPFIWQLWVTRIVPPDETRIYQSSHAFLAGIRGVVAPFVGFAVLQGLTFRTMGFISFALSLIATIMMIPLLHPDRKF